MHKIIYKILDKYFQNDFSNDLTAYLKESEEPLIVFDVGCYVGNFSRKIKKKLVNKKIEFYLFDPNPKLKIKDFSYNNIALSNKKGNFDYHLNLYIFFLNDYYLLCFVIFHYFLIFPNGNQKSLFL